LQIDYWKGNKKYNKWLGTGEQKIKYSFWLSFLVVFGCVPLRYTKQVKIATQQDGRVDEGSKHGVTARQPDVEEQNNADCDKPLKRLIHTYPFHEIADDHLVFPRGALLSLSPG
jgi:hypothetical protein